MPGPELDLAFQGLDELRDGIVVRADDHVAAAVGATPLAEGQVRVEGERLSAGVGAPQPFDEFRFREVVLPDRRHGIARVSWPRAVVVLDEFAQIGRHLVIPSASLPR